MDYEKNHETMNRHSGVTNINSEMGLNCIKLMDSIKHITCVIIIQLCVLHYAFNNKDVLM